MKILSAAVIAGSMTLFVANVHAADDSMTIAVPAPATD